MSGPERQGGEVEVVETCGPEETARWGRSFAARLAVGDCVGLVGPLGAGKTLLVRAIATGLGVPDPRIVASPTYVLVHEYPARVPIYHLDLYRMGDPPAELADLGVEEMLADGVVLVEWADRAAGALPVPRRDVEIQITAATGRRLRVSHVS